MKRGFTLLELIIVVIIIGVLASLAVPQFIKTVERSRTAEGVSLLGVYRGSQLRYYAENQAYTTTITDLDVTTTTTKFFDMTALDGTDAQFDIARATRKANSDYDQYILEINADGNVSCTPNAAKPLACTQLGF